MINETIRWKSRYNGDFHPKYIEFIELISKAKNLREEKVFDVEFFMFFTAKFVKLFDGFIRVMKEYLQYKGIFQVTHREVIKECFSNEIIFDGQDWINMLYDVERLERAIPTKDDIDLIIGKYFDLITKMYEYFEKNRVHNGR